jgi:hypothetical protein
VIVRYVASGGGGTVAPPPRYFCLPNLIMLPNQAIKNRSSPQ